MADIPVIQIDPFPNPTTLLADVVIPSAVCGVEAEGTAYRMDGLSLRMKKVVDSPYPTDEEIIQNILDRVRRLGDDN
jgi:formylmethanofuran dehydrogenase subunit B